MDNVLIYTKENCHFCVKAKQLLNMKGINFTESVVGKDMLREEFMSMYPEVKTVPLIFIDEQKVGSYEDLREYFDNQPQLLTEKSNP